MTEETIYLLYLDDYHAADELFLQSLARVLTRHGRGRRIIVHGSGEHAERLLEAEGIFRRRASGVLPVETSAEHAIVERAIRRLNRKIVATLTEAVVSTVGVLGTQRRLLEVRNGSVETGELDWLRSLLEQGVVPVVAAYAAERRSGRVGEISLPEAVLALANGFKDAGIIVVVFFTKTNLPGLMSGGEPVAEIRVEDIQDSRVVPDPEALQEVVKRGLRVLLTNTTRFADPAGPVGTRVTST